MDFALLQTLLRQTLAIQLREHKGSSVPVASVCHAGTWAGAGHRSRAPGGPLSLPWGKAAPRCSQGTRHCLHTTLPQAHVGNGSLQLHTPGGHQRMAPCVFYGDFSNLEPHSSSVTGRTTQLLPCCWAGHHQGCPVPDLGTAKARWLKVSQSSPRLPSGLGHSLEGAACCGPGLGQRQEGASAPPTQELQVFSLELSMGLSCGEDVCTEELC